MISDFFEEVSRKGMAKTLKQTALRWLFDSLNGSGSWDEMTARESARKQELWELERILVWFGVPHDVNDSKDRRQAIERAIKESGVSVNPVTGEKWSFEQVNNALGRLDAIQRERLTPHYTPEQISNRRFHDAEEPAYAEYMSVLSDPSATELDKERAFDRYSKFMKPEWRNSVIMLQLAVERLKESPEGRPDVSP